jgi:hypothetical protein
LEFNIEGEILRLSSILLGRLQFLIFFLSFSIFEFFSSSLIFDIFFLHLPFKNFSGRLLFCKN